MESLNNLESLWSKKRRVNRAWFEELPHIFSKRMFTSLIGVVTALLVTEIAIRPFATNSINRTISRAEVRQYYEGTAVSHFMPDGMRATGNQFIPGARAGLILGDSHVDAVQVSDEATMGSVLERISRAQGRPLNVHQYGWSGVAAPMYMAMAEQLLREYDPSWVAITLNEGDLGTEPLSSAWAWRMKINPDCSVNLVDVSSASFSTGIQGRAASMLNTARSHSSLISVAVETASKIMMSNQTRGAEDSKLQGKDKEDDSEVGLVPHATVRGLKQAYGSHLLIVFTPHIGVVGDDEPDDLETKLMDACRQEGVSCTSTRQAMLADRAENSRLSRGFHNTAPGSGHLNEVGHEIVAKEIWRMIAAEEPSTAKGGR